MLELAKKHQDDISQKIGYENVKFVMAKIQDMALDMERVQQYLNDNPIQSLDDQERFNHYCNNLKQSSPLIEDKTADVVVSNCVLNLVRPEDKRNLFNEIYRVLKLGGRAVISDIVCDEEPTEAIRNDPHLWSGCIAGAFLEHEFLKMFEDAGFHGIEILARQDTPWQIIEGIEFRSMTLRAWKPQHTTHTDHQHAVVYKGPWKQITDDHGYIYPRGQRIAVSSQKYQALTDQNSIHVNDFIAIPPYQSIDENDAPPFNHHPGTTRSARNTKGIGYNKTETIDDCCSTPNSSQDTSSGNCCE